jgi:hypothetical protein
MGKVMEVNVSTGEVIERDMTADELAQQAASKVESMAREANQESKAAQKLAIYEKLGLTPDEIEILIG